MELLPISIASAISRVDGILHPYYTLYVVLVSSPESVISGLVSALEPDAVPYGVAEDVTPSRQAWLALPVLLAGGQDAQASGADNRLRAAVYPEFAVDVVGMHLDRA